ncbi:MAG: alpha/beta hydrolase [Deltaproteobacteria bacterium]|nr:alpha/beta hydrolase [Deltaproteobacteria bacterium]
MKKFIRIFAILLIITILAVILVLMREDRLSIKFYPGFGEGEGKTLVVLLPTVAGQGKLYEQQGLIDICRKHGAIVDIMAIDVQPTLYLKKRIVKKMKSRVIDPAKARGYKHIYLLGTSLGGHAALLYTMEYPHDIEGLFLFAPFISDPFVTNIISEAGGLQTWDVCPQYAWEYSCKLWKSIRSYVSDPERRSSVFLGYGTEDRFVESCQVLAEVLPPENVFTAPGGHSWKTWQKLWEKMLKHLKIAKPAGFTKVP